MCGILGVVGDGIPQALQRDTFEHSLDLMYERGPDDRGVAYLDGAWLGHRRLSILDIAGGRQPMASQDLNSWIVYNGEVYNFRDVALRLLPDLPLRTRSDTEVVLESLNMHGQLALAQFRGMFSLAMYDQQRRALLLARDAVGVKPLFYALSQGLLFFASEIEPLRRLLPRATPDLSALISYLRYGFIPEPETAYGEIRALEPGQCLVFSEGETRITQYWRPRLTRLAEREPSTTEMVRAAVELATVSDVPLAALLSGGLDSAVVASVLGRRARYYNISFGRVYDESERARQTATTLSLDLQVERCSIDVETGEVEALLRKVGQPFADTSIFPSSRVFRAVSAQHKVCLAGDGADEVYAGYLLRRVIALQLATSPLSRLGVRAPRATVARALHATLRWYFRRRSFWLERAIRPDLLRGYHDPYDEAIRHDIAWAMSETDDLVNIASYVLLRRTLPNDMLVKVDRASMLHSVEVRVPFLDPVLVEHGLRLPGLVKQNLRETKRPLRRILLAKGFEREFVANPKRGFGPSPNVWNGMFVQPTTDDGPFDAVLTSDGRAALRHSAIANIARIWQNRIYGSRSSACGN